MVIGARHVGVLLSFRWCHGSMGRTGCANVIKHCAEREQQLRGHDDDMPISGFF